MKILLIFFIFFGSSCSSIIKNHSSAKNPPHASKVELPEFEKADINNDGEISKAEFDNISESSEIINYSIMSPIIVVSIIFIITMLCCVISSIFKCRKTE
jgi:hypothetical protein